VKDLNKDDLRRCITEVSETKGQVHPGRGMAVNLLGFPRTTADMDILVELSGANLRKIVRTLKKLGYKVKQPVDPMLITDKNTREDWIKNKHLKTFNFYKYDELREVDIILQSPVSYAEAKKTP
jgi:hypothetical protein